MRSEGCAQQCERQRMLQTEKHQQRVINVVPVGIDSIGGREGDVRCISVVVRVMGGMRRLGRRQQTEQMVAVVFLVRVLMVVPYQPKPWQRQPGNEEQHKTQDA